MRARLVRVRVRVIGLGAGRSRVGAPSQRGGEGLGKGLDEGLGKGVDEGLGKGVDEGLGKGVASPLFEVSSVAAAAALSSSASNILMAWASSCYHVRCKAWHLYERAGMRGRSHRGQGRGGVHGARGWHRQGLHARREVRGD